LKLAVSWHHLLYHESPPARGRGLKQSREGTIMVPSQSPPARGRGLKHGVHARDPRGAGRPLRGGVD